MQVKTSSGPIALELQPQRRQQCTLPREFCIFFVLVERLNQ